MTHTRSVLPVKEVPLTRASGAGVGWCDYAGPGCGLIGGVSRPRITRCRWTSCRAYATAQVAWSRRAATAGIQYVTYTRAVAPVEFSA